MWPVVLKGEEERGEERKEERVLLPPALRIYKSRLAALVSQIDRRKADMH